MSDTVINWSDLYKDATTAVEGEFTLIVDEAVATKSSTGKDMIKAKLRIESGHYAGRPLWHNFTISPESPAAMRMFFSHMSAFGIGQAFFSQNPTTDQLANALIGRRIIAEVGSRQWQGVDREEIKSFKTVPGGGPGTAPVVAVNRTLGGSTPNPAASTPSPTPTPSATPSPSPSATPSLAPSPSPELPF